MSYGIIYKQKKIYSVYVSYQDYSYVNHSYSESELWLKVWGGGGGGGGGLVEKFKYWFATLKNGTGAASILT